MSLIREFQDLMRSERAVSGRVVSVSDGLVRVATSAGVVEVAGNGHLQTGDTVTVQNGRAVKKRLDRDTSVFFI